MLPPMAILNTCLASIMGTCAYTSVIEIFRIIVGRVRARGYLGIFINPKRIMSEAFSSHYDKGQSRRLYRDPERVSQPVSLFGPQFRRHVFQSPRHPRLYCLVRSPALSTRTLSRSMTSIVPHHDPVGELGAEMVATIYGFFAVNLKIFLTPRYPHLVTSDSEGNDCINSWRETVWCYGRMPRHI